MHYQIKQLLTKAFENFQTGNFDEAEQISHQILKTEPKNFDALHIAGIVKGLKNQHQEALELFRRALRINSSNYFLNFNIAKAFSEIGEEEKAIKYHLIATKLDPTNSEGWLNFGRSLSNIKKYTESLDCYIKAHDLRPDYAEAWNNKGSVLILLMQYEDALASIDKSLKINPQLAETWCNRGNALQHLKKYDEALSAYDKAVSINPNLTEAWYNCGISFQELKKYEEALTSYDKAISINCDLAEQWSNRGMVLRELERFEEALASYDKAISINPELAELWSNRGVALRALKEYEKALASYDIAISINPDDADALYNRGNALQDLMQYKEAIASYDKAISINPDLAKYWYNRGISFQELKKYEEALTCYDKAISIDHEYAEAYWNKSLIQLLTEDFQGGWANYDYRWRLKEADKNHYQDIPSLTNLNQLKYSTVLVWSEQGFGDTIQFSRYVNLLTDMGVNVIFDVQAPLKSLAVNSFPELKVITKGEPVDNVDFQVPLMSLPKLFGTNLSSIPSTNIYLNPVLENFNSWKSKLNLNSSKLNIGIACSGNETHKNDKNRSIDLSAFEYLSNIANLFVIQKDLKEKDRFFLNDHPQIKFLGEQIFSFEDSASIVKLMDLIITVDTSLVHLSGALGMPTKVMVTWCPEWRWLLERKDCPWYPSVQVFRQLKAGDWESVIQDVISELKLGA
jgi:tetratricopeptide (TPR) repeat protein